MEKFIEKAYGKINLGLDVKGKREDGYHEVKMVMQSLEIADDIQMEIQEEGILLSTNMADLPVDENNLAYKACNLLGEEFGIQQGVKIHIEKRIPVAAGMAGGSADAAVVLKGMNQLFQLGLSIEELMERGKKLGADIPYCLFLGTALAEGIGEQLTPLPDMPECFFVLAKPSIFVSTREVYEKIDQHLDEVPLPIEAMIEGILEGNLKKITDNLGNVLERVTIKEYPIIQEIKEALLECGAVASMMSGSGPTVFGIFETEEEAIQGKKKLEQKNLVKEIYLTKLHQLGRSVEWK